MQTGVIEKITLDAPRFPVHLIPLRAWIGIHVHLSKFQRAFSGFRRCARAGDHPRRTRWRTLPEKHLFPVSRNQKVAHAAGKRLRLSRLPFPFPFGRPCRFPSLCPCPAPLLYPYRLLFPSLPCLPSLHHSAAPPD